MYEIFWLIMLVLLTVTEILTFNFITIWFAAGSLAALISSLCGADIMVQMWVFIIISVLSLIFTKPLVKNKLNFKKTETNADRVIGKTAIVTDEINSEKFAGEVKVNGQMWSAISYENEIIEKDSKVKILDIEGVKLVVEKLPVD